VLDRSQPLYLGIDFGTSGCRIALIDDNGLNHGLYKASLPPSTGGSNHAEQNPLDWWHTLKTLIDKLDIGLKQRIKAIAVDGTSSSLLLADKHGNPLTPCLMYNDQRALGEAQSIISSSHAIPSAAKGPSSALAKLLYLEKQAIKEPFYALHQADWISNKLAGEFGYSDSNNCLKLGYDPQTQCWPEEVIRLINQPSCLPKVMSPSSVISHIDLTISDAWSLPKETLIIAGMTDSIAASFAAGAKHPGDAVTSLGSTLVVKVVSTNVVSSDEYGIYSHPYNGNWLVGGASNTGGAALLKHFNLEQIKQLSQTIDPEHETGLDYYPLPAVGERFPFSDSAKKSRTLPRPDSDAEYFQAMLEGISNIEKLAYERLTELGATPVKRIISIGGGSNNTAWQNIRERRLQSPMSAPLYQETACGSALLAREGYSQYCKLS